MKNLKMIQILACIIVVLFVVDIYIYQTSNLPKPYKIPADAIWINGQIDAVLVGSFLTSTQFLKHHDVVIFINSSGGWVTDTLTLGRAINVLKQEGHQVWFFVNGICTSGCFILAGFADKVYLAPNSTFGFGHKYSDVAPIYDVIGSTMYLNRGMSNATFYSIMNLRLTDKQSMELHLVDFAPISVMDFESYFATEPIFLTANAHLGNQ